MLAVLLGYVGFALIVASSVVGPLLAGRWLAEHEGALDPEIAAIEAQALRMLAGEVSSRRR